MNKILRFASVVLFLIAVSVGYSALPALNVTVSDGGGKVAFKGATNATGAFTTTKLTPGNYVVQLNSSSSELKGKQYAVVVAAGKKKVSADVAGEKFAGGGVAMKVDVAPGLNITGQVAPQTGPISKNGKKMVWITKQLGSNLPGHWVEEDSAEAIAAKNAGTVSKDRIQNIQNKARGSGNE